MCKKQLNEQRLGQGTEGFRRKISDVDMKEEHHAYIAAGSGLALGQGLPAGGFDATSIGFHGAKRRGRVIAPMWTWKSNAVRRRWRILVEIVFKSRDLPTVSAIS